MAHVKVGGVPLHSQTRVSDLTWRHGADGGCLEASWTTSQASSGLPLPSLRQDALVEVFHGLERVWLGRLTEPGEDASQCYATGLFAQTERYMAEDGSGPTDDVHDALTQAIADGLHLTYLGDTPTLGGQQGVTSEEPQRLSEAIRLWATANNVRATVRADGVLRWESDPTAPELAILPGVGMLSRANEDYATRVKVRYVASVSGTPPVADSFAIAEAIDTDAEAALGERSTVYVRVESRGLLTATEAQWIADGILAKFGARLTFTDALTVTSGQLRTIGGGRVSLATVRAGVMVRALGVRTPVGHRQRAFDVLIGATSYTSGSDEITLSPIGLVPRNLADVVASIPTVYTALNPSPGAGAASS